MASQTVMEDMENSTFQLTEEQSDIKQYVREFAETIIAPRSAQIDEDAKFPWDIFKEMVDNGLVGMAYPEKYCRWWS